MHRKLRMGMVGGGKGAFIGAIHRFAANSDGLIQLVCGALSADPENAKESGQHLFLQEDRIYTSFEEMVYKEKQLPENIKMDFVSIVTPNHLHFEQAMLALDSGFHVMVEKPMTMTLQEAKTLEAKVNESGKVLGLAHTYTGYPMVKEAKELVSSGKLGKIRKVFVNYHQGWLSKLSEKEGNKQASWRTDPNKSGKCGAMGDIGVHAFNLAEYITGLTVTHLCAELNTIVDGRALDDDGAVLLKFDNGASGVLTATQVAAGEENALNIKIYGENGGIEWHQMEPNTLYYRPLEGPAQVLRSGMPHHSDLARFNSRTPPGHPEGYLEAFANLYRNFALRIQSLSQNESEAPSLIDFPTVRDGVRGMAFIENVVLSNQSNEKWTPFHV